jgi:polysaccharide biosynthesis transport protein
MNYLEMHSSPNRSASRGKFLTRLDRYTRLLATKWWILVLPVLLGTGAGFGISRFGKSSFTSYGRMIVNVKLSLPEGSVYTEELSNFLGTQAALMQSGAVINRAHQRVLAASQNLESQLVALRVNVLPKTTIFTLQAMGEDPGYTQLFLQACMDEYSNLKKEMRTQTSDTTVSGLTEQLLRVEKELHQAERELVEFQSSNSVVLLQEQGNTAGSYLAALSQRLSGLKSESELLQRLTLEQNLERRQLVSEALPSSGDGFEKANFNPLDTEYLKAKQQNLLLRADQQEMAQYLRPRHPRMVAMNEEITRRERLLEILRQQSTDQLESRKSSLALQIQTLEKSAQEWDARTLQTSRKTSELQRLRANAQRTQALYDRLLATLQTLDVNREISPESVTVIERASPALPSDAKLLGRLVKAGLVGLAIGLAILMLVDHLDDRLSNLTEFQDAFEEQLLAQVPREGSARGNGQLDLIRAGDERHSFIESYRNLRSSLLFLDESARRPRTLVFTSSVPNEGKSLTISNLAIVLADSGTKVLLVDADLRKGGLHSRFNVDCSPGLSQVLAGETDWQVSVRKTSYSNLWLLPRGPVTHRSGDFFLGPITKKLLTEAKEYYDLVLLDTAPVMAADDVTTLAPLADGVVFVLRAEHTSARVARAALALLYQRESKLLGVVLNAVRARSGDYYYCYQYNEYYASQGRSMSRQVS